MYKQDLIYMLVVVNDKLGNGKSVYVSVSVCVCVIPLVLFQIEFWCLFSRHHVNQGGVQKPTPQVTFYLPTLLKSLSGDAEVAGTARYCLAMRATRGMSCKSIMCSEPGK